MRQPPSHACFLKHSLKGLQDVTATKWLACVSCRANGGVRAGCTFADFDGYRTFYAHENARVSLVQGTFAGNTIFPLDTGAAVIEASAHSGSCLLYTSDAADE